MCSFVGCNSTEARRICENRFPDRRQPDNKTFQRLDERLRKIGT